ncbi:MAG: ribose-phosphate diphosphokinase [Thermoprotei archaeon]|nr:MAG: ribose-phosphate diphosphokinase [Thermoprotei archaeon]RLF02146.1 MAG: ribose-phosphate diphosphokinase [Thermoprotei archaeon]
MIVVGGPASTKLASNVARELGVQCISLEYKVFPDGESYIRYPLESCDVKGEDVVIVQSLYPPQDKHFVELLFAIDALRHLGAGRIAVVVPYLAYSRQDKVFLPGENVSVRTILRSIERMGADYFLTIDIHKEESLNFLSIPSFNITAVPLLSNYIKGLRLEEILVLAPDRGALWRAEMASRFLGAEYDYLEKYRDRSTGEVSVKPKSLSVKGRTVVIIDDIISTGGTVALAAKVMKELGAHKVIAACTHPLLVGNALEKMYNSGVERVIGTNTIPSTVSVVDVAEIIVEKLKSILKPN